MLLYAHRTCLEQRRRAFTFHAGWLSVINIGNRVGRSASITCRMRRKLGSNTNTRVAVFYKVLIRTPLFY